MLKHDIAAICFFKWGKNYSHASFPSHRILFEWDEANCNILSFRTINYDSHFLFWNETKSFYRYVFIAMNIVCKFGADIFINE